MRRIPSPSTVEMAEILALRYELEVSVSRSIHNIIGEGDSQKLFSSLLYKPQDVSEFGPLRDNVLDIHMFFSVLFLFSS